MSHLILIPRSFPVASVSLNITDFPAEVKREQKNCMANGVMTAWYMIFLIIDIVYIYMLFLIVSILVCVVASLVKD